MSSHRYFVRKLMRELLRVGVAPFLSWSRLENPRDGFSIVLGTPWALRELLAVNLEFVSRCDLDGLDALHVVFDRTRKPGAEEFIERIQKRFPGLPLEFHFHPPVAGWLVDRIGQSKFYAATNWATGLAACRTRYAVMHDFDLYPVQPDFFLKIVEAMRSRGLRFSGAEFTRFDALTDDDRLIGTWELGVDVAWIRQHHRPIHCFHKIASVNGRSVDLDPFSWLQYNTPERDTADGVGPDSFIHVRNLCSTYLRYTQNQSCPVVWRLHFLWYLESCVDSVYRLAELADLMRGATSSRLVVDGRPVDFSGTHWTCANVLRTGLHAMELALNGRVRPEVQQFVDATESFLKLHGKGWGEQAPPAQAAT